MQFSVQFETSTMRRLGTSVTLIASFAAIWSAPALAYIGPGAGITVLGALWGVIVAIVLTVGAVVLWPFRVLLRRRRKRSAKSSDAMVAETPMPRENTAEQSDANSPRKPG